MTDLRADTATDASPTDTEYRWSEVPRRVEAVLAAGLVLVASLAYRPFFDDSSYVPVIALGVVLIAGLTVVGDVRRWSSHRVVTVGLVTLPVYLLATLYSHRSLPGTTELRALGNGLVNGWARMLSVSLPVEPRPQMLVTPVAIAWVAGLMAAVLALHTRSRLLPLAPSLAAFIIALAFSAPRDETQLGVTAGLAFGYLVFMLLSTRRSEAAAGSRRPVSHPVPHPSGGRWPNVVYRARATILFAAPVVLAAPLVAVGGAALASQPDANRLDPRTFRQQPLHIDQSVTPLARLKGELTRRRPTDVMDVRLDVPPEINWSGLRIRLAALTKYDGAIWTSDDRYLRTSTVLPAGPSYSGGQTEEISGVVRIRDLPAPFLPVIGQPIRLDASGVGFNAFSGNVVTARNDLANYRYSFVAEVHEPTRAEQRNLLPGTGPAVARFLALPPDVPPDLRDITMKVTQGKASMYDSLLAIATYLRTRVGYNIDAPPGHSLDALQRTLTGAGKVHGGYAEQLASLFAVMARLKGYPSRVAVGFTVNHPPTIRTFAVTTSEAHAWPEVFVQGQGWVAFEPTPTDRTSQPQKPPPNNVSTEQDNDQAIGPPPVLPNVISGGTQSHGGPGPAQRLATGTGISLLLVLLLLLLIPAAKAARRAARRRRGSEARRVLAAWRETCDRFLELGLRPSGHLTANEIADSASERLGEAVGRPSSTLALVVTETLFSGTPPPSGMALRSWQLFDDARRGIPEESKLPKRLRALFDPRPLVPRRRRRTSAARSAPRRQHRRQVARA